MRVLHDSDHYEPEITIAAPPEEFLDLGRRLMELRDSLVLRTDPRPDEVWPVVLEGVEFRRERDVKDARFDVALDGGVLRLSGGEAALTRLGESLTRFFSGDVDDGDQFHLDYYEGNPVLAPTRCHLVFMSERRYPSVRAT